MLRVWVYCRNSRDRSTEEKVHQGSLEARAEEFELCSADNRPGWAPSSCFSAFYSSPSSYLEKPPASTPVLSSSPVSATHGCMTLGWYLSLSELPHSYLEAGSVTSPLGGFGKVISISNQVGGQTQPLKKAEITGTLTFDFKGQQRARQPWILSPFCRGLDLEPREGTASRKILS